MRTYYYDNISDFLIKSNNTILGSIQSNFNLDTTNLQNNAWEDEINILKNQLKYFTEGKIIFEYTIPRVGKRVDVVFLHNNIIFLLEFKCGEFNYNRSDLDQVIDYALDLCYFHKESENKIIVPILVATKANDYLYNEIDFEKEKIIKVIRCNQNNISDWINKVCSKYTEISFDYDNWINSLYYPTPTIVEAAQALYKGHNVKEITRSDADTINLSNTTNEINRIIEYSKNNNEKSICFVTGVPGAGKTLVGLNLAIQHSNAENGQRAVFLSGNQPLVSVLQEALARDMLAQKKLKGERTSKENEKRKTVSFIQIIHKYRDEFVGNNKIPPERIAIFDEAQRAWTKEKISSWMEKKKRILNFNYSEPEFLISTLDRHKDWAVIVCLVGGGQEINTGEAGLPEWFDSIRRSYPHWKVYLPNELKDDEYLRGRDWWDMLKGINFEIISDLHLSTSVRSFRTPDLASLVKSILDNNLIESQNYYSKIKDKYPLFITRNLSKAKDKIKELSKGTERYGIIASSGAIRLKPEGIFVKCDVSIENWFLNDNVDVRSSYGMEDVVTEFDIQGLEIDYTIVAWDADFRYINGSWEYKNFSGAKWQNIKDEIKRLYLKNAYRVLLTRARQGMILFVPEGNDEDETRKKEFYDGTYNFLKSIGIEEL